MLVIKRHRTFYFSVIYYLTYKGKDDPGNVPFNLTGGTARAQIRRKLPAKKGKDPEVIANLNVTMPVPVSGELRIEHDRIFTGSLKNMSPDEIEWDLVFTDTFGRDWNVIPVEPVKIFTPPTNPEDTGDFIPGGGGAVYHTHPLSQIIGIESGIEEVYIDGDGRLHFVKSGFDYAYTPFSVIPVP